MYKEFLKKSILFIAPFISFFLGYFIISHYFFAAKIIVPSLIGKQLSDCAPSLAQQKLSLRFLSEREDLNLPEGTIIEQIPAAGQTIRPQQQILIITTKKPKTPSAPNCYGLDQEAIQQIAQKDGLSIKEIHIPQKKEGICYAQSPSKHQIMNNKTLTIGLGKKEQTFVIMPNLYEQSVQQICQLLKKTNIKLEIFYQHQQIAPQECQEYLCISQNPIPGSLINSSNSTILQIEIGL